LKYVNIILLIILSWFLAHSEINKKEVEYFDDNVYSYSTNDTITVTHTIQLTKELEWATRLIQSEAMNEPAEGETWEQLDTSKMMLVWTIRNRITDHNERRGRNTDIFWQISRKGQIDGYQTKNWYRPLERHNIVLAYKSLYGENLLPKSIYYWHSPDPNLSTDTKHVRETEGENGKYIYKIIGGHVFCHEKKILKHHPEYLDII
jgi:hypothetical protein